MGTIAQRISAQRRGAGTFGDDGAGSVRKTARRMNSCATAQMTTANQNDPEARAGDIVHVKKDMPDKARAWTGAVNPPVDEEMHHAGVPAYRAVCGPRR